ncbi:hypothetical protein [Streptomyces sp. NPDC005876]|uniref:hypothetical protein n=1 Tax=unclassified Streptomyces TaxID=2593676 RepID=UPI00340EF88D
MSMTEPTKNNSQQSERTAESKAQKTADKATAPASRAARNAAGKAGDTAGKAADKTASTAGDAASAAGSGAGRAAEAATGAVQTAAKGVEVGRQAIITTSGQVAATAKTAWTVIAHRKAVAAGVGAGLTVLTAASYAAGRRAGRQPQGPLTRLTGGRI